MSILREAQASRRLDGETRVVEPIERPILFSAPMVLALLAGTKMQTRRLMKPQPHPGRYGATHPTNPSGIIGLVDGGLGGGDYHVWDGPRATACLTESGVRVALSQCPYGEFGDRLWVREQWRTAKSLDKDNATQIAEQARGAGYSKPMIPERWRADMPVNVWVGTTVENQEMAEERISELLRVPASVLFLSCEPLLGPVDLDLPRCDVHGREFVHKLNDGTECCSECSADGYSGELSFGHWLDPLNGGISWVICGGESGGGARPMQAEWARSLRDQCEAEGVAFHFKQWGEHNDGLVRIGKKKAGRLLDGRTWDELPEVRT